jgi:hypothetical protein
MEPAAPRPAESAGKSEQDEHTPRRIMAKPPESKKPLHDAFLAKTAVQQGDSGQCELTAM